MKGEFGLLSLTLVLAFIGSATGQAVFSFMKSTDDVGESDNTINVCMQRVGSVADEVDIAVDFTTTGTLGASPPGDVTAISTFVFPSGRSSICQTVSITDDDDDEGDETFTITISTDNASDNIIIGTVDDITVTITDDDFDTYYFEQPSYTAEEPSTISVCMERSLTGTSRSIQVTFSGTATNGVDFTVDSDFDFNESDPRDCNTITIRDDNDAEPVETLVITISSSGNSDDIRIGNPASTTVTITDEDDDEMYYFEQDAYPVAESIGDVSVCMRRTETNGNRRTIQVSYTGETAISVSDFFVATSSFTFDDDEYRTCNPITIVNDIDEEPIETFTLTIQDTGISASQIGNPSTTRVTITDDDDETEYISWSSSSYSFTESQNQVSVVVTKTGTSRAATATLAAGSGSARSGSDFLISTTTVYFPSGSSSQNVFLTLYDDTEDEVVESFSLILTSATNNVDIRDAATTIYIQDDDFPTPAPKNGLSPGEIGGIVAGVIILVLLLIIIFIILCCCMGNRGGSNPLQSFLNPQQPRISPQRAQPLAISANDLEGFGFGQGQSGLGAYNSNFGL